MNFSFGFVLEKVLLCILCGQPITHQSPKVNPIHFHLCHAYLVLLNSSDMQQSQSLAKLECTPVQCVATPLYRNVHIRYL